MAVSAAQATELAEAAQPEVALVQRTCPAGETSPCAGSSAARRTRVCWRTRALRPREPHRDAEGGRRRVPGPGRPRREARGRLRGAAEGSTILDGVMDRGVIHELMEQVHEAEPAPRGARRKRARIRRVVEARELDIVFQPIVALRRARSWATRRSRASGRAHRPPNEWFGEAHEVGSPASSSSPLRLACERARRSRGHLPGRERVPETAERLRPDRALAGARGPGGARGDRARAVDDY